MGRLRTHVRRVRCPDCARIFCCTQHRFLHQHRVHDSIVPPNLRFLMPHTNTEDLKFQSIVALYSSTLATMNRNHDNSYTNAMKQLSFGQCSTQKGLLWTIPEQISFVTQQPVTSKSRNDSSSPLTDTTTNKDDVVAAPISVRPEPNTIHQVQKEVKKAFNNLKLND